MSRSTRQPPPARPARGMLAGALAGALALAALALAACGPVTSSAGNSGPAGTSAPAGSGTAPAGSSSPGQPPGSGGGPAAGQALCAAPGSVSRVVITKIAQGGPVIAIAPAARAGVAAATTAAAGPAIARTPGWPGTAAAPFTTAAVRPAPRAVTAAAGSPGAAPVVKGAAQARQLARQACALPAMPVTRVHCPLATTTGYRIVFTAAGRVLPPLTVQASGCERVTGAGDVRTAAGHPGFLKLLASLAGPVPLPGPGHLPGSSVSTGPFRPAGA